MPCSETEYPEELWAKGRERVEPLPEGCYVFRSITKDNLFGDKVLSAAFEVGWPEVSVNCSAFASADHCVFPHPKFAGMGAAVIRVADITGVVSLRDCSQECRIIVEHDPIECNYSHSIIGVLKDEERITREGATLSRSQRRQVRERIADACTIARMPER